MSVAHDPPRIVELAPAECWRLLQTEHVGRLGFLRNGQPDIVPLNYVLDGDAVVFATEAGTKLWAATRSPLAFEVDRLEPSVKSGWSVVVHGLGHEVTAADSVALVDRLHALDLSPWPGGRRDHLVRVPAQSITGRRVGPAVPAQ